MSTQNMGRYVRELSGDTVIAIGGATIQDLFASRKFAKQSNGGSVYLRKISVFRSSG